MIYFDNSSTTKINPSVLDTYLKVSEAYYGNPSSLHELGKETSSLLNQSRKQIAQLIEVETSEVYFTSGGTEGDNWVIKGTALEKEVYGKHLITTSIEHPAVNESMQQLETRGWEITYLPVNEEGRVSPKDVKEALRSDTVLVSIIAVNNEIGSIQPVDEIGEILKNYPSVHFHIDAVQSIGKVNLNLGKNSRVDMAVFSGHKFHAPRGVGFVYIKKGRQLAPLLSGGGQEKGFRSGTENLPGVVAMAKALRISKEELKGKMKEMGELTSELRNYLSSLKNVEIFTPKIAAPHILCFGIKGIRGEVTVHALEKEGIFVSTTSACSSRKGIESSTLLGMGVPKPIAETAIRVSLSDLNTKAEMNTFIEEFDKIYEQFESLNT